jgi:hypothetical protein
LLNVFVNCPWACCVWSWTKLCLCVIGSSWQLCDVFVLWLLFTVNWRDVLCCFFSAEHALMKCDVWSVVFCWSFNRLSIGEMQSMKCHGGDALRFLSAEYAMKCEVWSVCRQRRPTF